MDLVRQILLAIENLESVDQPVDLNFDEHSSEEVSYHVMLLDEADLIDAVEAAEFGTSSRWFPMRLTWQGHEFLDAARDDTRWNKAKDAMNKAGGFVFEVGKALLIQVYEAATLTTKALSTWSCRAPHS